MWGQLDIVLKSRLKAKHCKNLKCDGALGDKKPRSKGTVYSVNHRYRCKALTGEWRKFMYTVYSKEYTANFPFMVVCHEDYTPKEIVNKSMKVGFDWKPDWNAEVIYCNRYDWSCSHENRFSKRWKADGNDMFLVDPAWTIGMEAKLFGSSKARKKKEEDEEAAAGDDENHNGPPEEEEELGGKYDHLEDACCDKNKSKEERERLKKLQYCTLDRMKTLKAKHEVMDDSNSKSVELLDANDKVCGLLCQDFNDSEYIFAKLVFDSTRKLIGYVGWDSLDEIYYEFNKEMNKKEAKKQKAAKKAKSGSRKRKAETSADPPPQKRGRGRPRKNPNDQ